MMDIDRLLLQIDRALDATAIRCARDTRKHAKLDRSLRSIGAEEGPRKTVLKPYVLTPSARVKGSENG